MTFDYQKVRLISVTQPRIPEAKTAEDLIAYCARVSNPSNQTNTETAPKLLRYCADKNHWSVFEMADATIEIETTRDIGRQILRHRSFNFQEFSQRYADASQLGFTKREMRIQDLKNRQNSIDIDDLPTVTLMDEAVKLRAEWETRQKAAMIRAQDDYAWALKNNIAKEQARAILPEGMTMSRMYMKGNLRSWITYCNVRKANGTQKEHIDIANKCWDILCEEFSFLKQLEN